MTALAAQLAPGTWVVDPAQARAGFRAVDVLRRPVLGTLPVLGGRVEVGADGSVVAVTGELDLTGVSTGNDRRDRDLRGPRFFHVDACPVLHFRGGPARREGSGWVLAGALSLRGVECPVELLVEQRGPHRVRATTRLDRRDAGIRVPRVLVAHAVDVTVEASLVPPPGDAA